MMSFILTAVIVLGGIALIAALILFYCSMKFAVQEDPRIAQVTAVLPGANCGGCGFAGCSGLASALVKAADGGSLEGLNCPVGGADVMGKAADLLGMAVAATDPMLIRWWPWCVVTAPAPSVRKLLNTMVCSLVLL